MFHQFAQGLRRAAPVVAATALAFAIVAARPAPAFAQAATGTVIDSKSGRPLPDAVVTNTSGTVNQQARTNIRGEFRLDFTGTASLRVTRVGFQPLTVSATAGTPVRIQLVELVVKLDELVVTGTVGEQTTRSLGNAIGRVSVADNIVIAPPAKLQDMLSVNVPGVRIIRASGAIGSGGTTRIRGSGSISLTNEPLIYIDGIRSNNDAAASSGAFNFAQEAPSRINDLNPEDIESIEVLKGPSAATIYGTEASNGVIQVITKRGRTGRPVVDFRFDAGANWLQNPDGRYPSNYYYSQREKKVVEFNVLKFNKARGFPDVFSTGVPIAFGGSVSGGTDNLRYYFSTDFNRDEGMVDYNYQNKYSARANLTYTSTDNKFKVDFSLGGVRSRLRGASGFQPITTSILWACNFPGCEPTGPDTTKTGYNDAGHGYQFYRPEDYSMAQAYDNVDRTTFSLKFTHRPTSWLRQSLTVGPDFTNVKGSNLIEKAPDERGFPFFDLSAGFKQSGQNRQTFLTLDYNASGDWNISKSLLSTTSAGVQYYYKQFDQVFGSGQSFAIPGPSDISGGSLISSGERFQENKTFGVYAQQQFAYKNRFFLTGALRADDNSAFGSQFSAVYYPKVSLSWVASEEPFLANSRVFSTLKFRGAWGRAGQAPDIFSAIRTYQPKVGSSGLGGVSPQNFGNAGLKPEVGQEFELGFDASLFNNRIGIEFTYYNKSIKDAILSLPLKPSRGFPGQQFLNIGETNNKGIEIGLDFSPIQAKNVGLDLRATFSTNESIITDMGGQPPAFVGGSFIQQWNLQGYAPSSFWYKRVKGSKVQSIPIAGIPLPLGFDATCAGSTQIPKSDLGLEGGADVPCSEAFAVNYGRPTPSWSGALSATLTLNRRLRILALVDALGGNNVLVGDVAAVHAFFLSSKQVLEGSDPVLSGILGNAFLNGDANGIGVSGMFKGGFARLRTVSASYEFPTRVARLFGASRGTFTLAAENMAFLWRAQKEAFGVGWIDPEITPNRASDTTGNFGYTQESWPQAARIRTTVRLTF